MSRRGAWGIVLVASVALAAACTSFSGGDTPAPDAGADAPAPAPTPMGTPPDGGDDADAGTPRCGGDFAVVGKLDALDTSVFAENSPRFTDDEDMIVYETNQPAGGFAFDIWVATRASHADKFGGAGPLAGVNSDWVDAHPWIAPDGLRIFFASERTFGGPPFALYGAWRADAGGPFDVPVALPAPIQEADAAAGANYAPYASADGTELFFTSTRLGDGRIFRAPVVGSSFGAPVVVDIAGAPPGSRQEFPVLDHAGLTLYFALVDVADGGVDQDIWVATRPFVGAAFGGAQRLAALASTADELPGWLSRDGCRLYFTRNGVSDRDMYMAQRAP